jgi:hypothetical protein
MKSLALAVFICGVLLTIFATDERVQCWWESRSHSVARYDYSDAGGCHLVYTITWPDGGTVDIDVPVPRR